MLVITRRKGEKIQIGPDIEVMVSRIEGGQVRLSIKAPQTTKIVRPEFVQQPVAKG
jgi:carbon storage regulator